MILQGAAEGCGITAGDGRAEAKVAYNDAQTRELEIGAALNHFVGQALGYAELLQGPAFFVFKQVHHQQRANQQTHQGNQGNHGRNQPAAEPDAVYPAGHQSSRKRF